MKKTFSTRQLYEGERIPKYWGIAYQKFNQCEVVCYPYPLNIVIGFVRYWWLKTRYLWFMPYVQKLQNKVAALESQEALYEKKILEQEAKISEFEKLFKNVLECKGCHR